MKLVVEIDADDELGLKDLLSFKKNATVEQREAVAELLGPLWQMGEVGQAAANLINVGGAMLLAYEAKASQPQGTEAE